MHTNYRFSCMQTVATFACVYVIKTPDNENDSIRSEAHLDNHS